MKSGDYIEADIGMGLCANGIITDLHSHELNSGFIWVQFIDEKRPAPVLASNMRLLTEKEVFKCKLIGSKIREQK